MRIFPLLLCGALALPASAQQTASNGYELLVKAGKSYIEGEEGFPVTKNLAPQENLRRQRASVARNAKSLELIRQALQAGIQPPLLTDIEVVFSNNSKWRALTRLLAQEAAVRVASGKPAEAINSHLDAMEMGASLARNGVIVNALFGLALEYIGRSNMQIAAEKLDAAQCRAAAARLAQMEKLRPPLGEILRAEAAFMRREAVKAFAARRDPAKRAKEEEFQKASKADKRIMLAMTPARFNADLARLIEADVKRNRLSYQAAQKVRLPSTRNPDLDGLAEILQGQGLRFNLERSAAHDRLWRGALELRAQKLESGVYPRKFAAPLDPFSNSQPLIYKSDGDEYLLYSIGPDGKDDGGAEIQTVLTDDETGVQTISNRVLIESIGDIVAPVL
ncbi:MAG: hypothetical protein KY445_01120 [Armatimonadetes bacterium]|nr:hypothetical protein [Armatimonadota bacterium]